METTDNISEMPQPERLQLVLEELRNVQMKMQEVEQNQEKILEQLGENRNLIKGGSQPSKQIKVTDTDEYGNNVPGSTVVAKVMAKARNRSGRNGVSSSEVHKIVEDEGFERSRQSILNMMDKIGDSFSGFMYKKRKSNGQENVLFYKGDAW